LFVASWAAVVDVGMPSLASVQDASLATAAYTHADAKVLLGLI
jgi:hypothetical protein